MGLEGFYVELLAILLCLYGFDMFARAWTLYFLQRLLEIAFHKCTNVRGAKARAAF